MGDDRERGEKARVPAGQIRPATPAPGRWQMFPWRARLLNEDSRSSRYAGSNNGNAFARKRAGQTGCAMIFPTETFELDINNEGNRLIDYTRQLLRCGALVPRMRR